MEEKVLAFNFSGERLEKLELACGAAGAGLLCVPRERLGASIGELLSGDGPDRPGEPSGEMLVLCGLRDKALNAFLSALRGQGLSVPLKAVLTEHNKNWTPARLARELRAEHEAFRKNRP